MEEAVQRFQELFPQEFANAGLIKGQEYKRFIYGEWYELKKVYPFWRLTFE